MNEVVSPIWSVFEPSVVDRSIKSYELKEYSELNVTVQALSRYEITTRNSQAWKYLSGAFLYVKSRVNTPTGTIATVSNNGLNDFKIARLFYENKLLEEVDYVGIASTIMNLVEFSGDISDTQASQMMWYMDTADSASRQRYRYEEADRATTLKDSTKILETYVSLIKNNPTFNKGFFDRLQLTSGNQLFCKFIPLKRLFRFCQEVNKVLKGEIKIILEK